MKTKAWILIFSALALVCLGLRLFLLSAPEKKAAQVYSAGELIWEIDLTENAEYRVENGGGWNILTVKDGKICVSYASCPTQDCVKCGAQNSGAPIVCLPNRMVIEFSDAVQLDALAH